MLWTAGWTKEAIQRRYFDWEIVIFSQSIVKMIRRFIVPHATFATRGTSMKTKHEVTQVDMLTHKVVLEYFQFKFTLVSRLPKPLGSNSDLMNHTVTLSKHVGNI